MVAVAAIVMASVRRLLRRWRGDKVGESSELGSRAQWPAVAARTFGSDANEHGTGFLRRRGKSEIDRRLSIVRTTPEWSTTVSTTGRG